MSARLRQLLAEIEGAPSMRPACDRWAAELRAELAERATLPPPSAAERLRTLSEAIDRALYGQSSAGFSPAHEALAAGWLLELQSVLAELVEQGAPATDDPRFEALRLATSLRREEEAARRGVVVSGGLARLGELHKLEALLSRLALGTLAETPIEQLLAVALDLAEEQGEYSEGLRRQVARQLGVLKLCTPWREDEVHFERVINECATGRQLISVAEEGDETGHIVDLTYTLYLDNRQPQFGLTIAEAERRAAEWLCANGWVQVQAQPEEAEPTTDERSYAPEDLHLEEEAP